jgi:hypothetical protein
MNRSELKKNREVGEKRKLSYPLDRSIKKAESDFIVCKTAEFIANNGEVQHIEPGVMNTPTKGHTALRIKHDG